MDVIELSWAAPISCALEADKAPDSVPTTIGGEVWDNPVIVSKGGARPTQPLKEVPDIHLQVARLVGAPDSAVVSLVEKIGFLGKLDGQRESVGVWRKLAAEILSMPGMTVNGRVGFSLARDHDGKLYVAYSPTTLLDAIKLKAANMVASGAEFFNCRVCNQLSERGGLSPLRLDATFCSDRCRNKHKNKKAASRRVGEVSGNTERKRRRSAKLT